ncbi:hypothetical protein FIBSPDRAFT_871724 [Athelia psychrophila]|uniref:Uncharacterized protein n=1 Tax=Athelia psychrophila TaxID=1759441 RepID=A0A166A3X0_9AGAM|nr:hypothetical protein FIBSPDRAFT_871724 [Fibularhizoctonia sp. CBS 109695]
MPSDETGGCRACSPKPARRLAYTLPDFDANPIIDRTDIPTRPVDFDGGSINGSRSPNHQAGQSR